MKSNMTKKSHIVMIIDHAIFYLTIKNQILTYEIKGSP
jgi:hypothetical protein